jgi:hypothetical protein
MITRLKSQGIELDLTEGVPVPLNFSISDIREPNTRKRNFSKEIVLPGTAKNMLFFKGSFNFTQSGVDAFFDPTTQVECELTKDEFLVMKGLIQLKSVTILNNYVSFQVLIYSDAVDLFLALQNTKVAELDWSDYDHTLNQTNIIASWTTAAGSGYYYPLIQKGTNPSALIYRTIDLYPYIYLREAFIKCFELAGVSISGAFINSTRFSQVLFGYGGGELTSVPDSVALQRRVEISDIDFVNPEIQPTNGIQVVGINQLITHLIPFNLTTLAAFTDFNPLLQFDGNSFTAAFIGDYSIDFDFAFDITLLAGGWELITPTIEFLVIKNGQEISQQEGALTYGSGIITTVAAAFNTQQNVSLVSGDQLIFVIRFRYNASQLLSIPIALNDTSTTGGLEIKFTSVNISDGDTVFINRFIPEMTCADLVMNTFRQFNLYMTDIDSGTVEISPFPSFYSNTNQFDDWSELLDIGKEIIVKPAANEYGKNVKFMFAEIQESDAINHFNKWGKRYGDLTHNQGSYYAKADKQIKLGWGTIIPYDIGTTQVVTVPRFMLIDPFTNATKACKAVPRIMNRLGLITGGWSLQSADGVVQQSFATYPAVHHFNSRTNPTFDLNFMLVDEVYYPTTVVTTVNSFSEYYFDMINEIVSPEGKLISAYFRLDNELIESFNLKRLVMVNGALFRVNKIIDFDSDIQATTKVELIKVLRPKTRNRVQLTLPIATLPGDVIDPNPFDPTTDDIISSPPNSVITKKIIR